MAISKTMRRLLRIRDLEEEHRRLALESALTVLHSLEGAQDAANARERTGRTLMAGNASAHDPVDRHSGLVEVGAAQALSRYLAPRIAAAEHQSIECQQQFLEKRVERRQAATLIEAMATRDAVEANRRTQQNLDDWYGSGKHRASLVRHEKDERGAPDDDLKV